jgi:hypothetical protein
MSSANNSYSTKEDDTSKKLKSFYSFLERIDTDFDTEVNARLSGADSPIRFSPSSRKSNDTSDISFTLRESDFQNGNC